MLGTFTSLVSLTKSNVTLIGGVYTNGFEIKGSFVTIQGVEASASSGVCVRALGHDLILDGITAHDCPDHGIYIYNTYNVTLKNSTVYHTAMMNQSKTLTSGWPSGIKVKISNNILLENNTVFNNYGEGFGLRGSYITVRGNTVYDNYSIGIYANSDNLLVEKNFVYCTGDPEFDRTGLPMNGIAIGEEFFTGWGAHAYNETVINNIVSGCKYGFSYNGAEDGVTGGGLRDSVIAFNTFYQTKQAGVRILYVAAQKNVLIANNVTTTAPKLDNPTGITMVANKAVSLAGGTSPTGFKLPAANSADSAYSLQTDFSGSRSAPLDIGAWDFGGTTTTSTPASTSTVVATNTSTAVPTKTSTLAPTKTATPTSGPGNTPTTTSGPATFTPTVNPPATATLTSTPIVTGILSAGIYDDSNPNIVYIGTWSLSSCATCYGGKLHVSNVIGNSSTFAFNGGGFTLSYQKNTSYGRLEVYVDGVLVASLAHYNTTTILATWTSPAFTVGTHTVQLVHLLNKEVSVDAVQIYPGAPPAP